MVKSKIVAILGAVVCLLSITGCTVHYDDRRPPHRIERPEMHRAPPPHFKYAKPAPPPAFPAPHRR